MTRSKILPLAVAGGFLLSVQLHAADPVVSSQPAETAGDDIGWLDLDELAQIKVSTVARKEVEVGKTAAAVHVITAEDIRRSGVTSIQEALRMAPGVDVARVDARRYAISIRGLNKEFSNKLLALQDGRSLYTPSFGGVFWFAQDYELDDIERIEVVRGPGGTSWGANAMNGVINIITKGAEDTQGTLVKAGGGTFEQAFATLRHGGKVNDHTWYRAFVKAYARDDTIQRLGMEAPDDAKQVNGGVRIDSLPSDQTRITVIGGGFVDLAEQSVVQERTTFHGGHLLGRFQHVIDDGSELTLQTYYDGLRIDGLSFGAGWDQFDFDGQYRRELTERLELNSGLNYRLFRSDGTVTPATLVFGNPIRNTHLFGAFTDLEYALIPDRLSVSTGVKGQYNSFNGWDPLPNARMVFTADEKNTIWAAYSEGIALPTLAQDDLTVMTPIPATPLVNTTSPNTGLDSERLQTFELGWRTRPISNVSLDLAGFYSEYDDLVSIETSGFAPFPFPPGIPLTSTYGNGVEGEAYGIEASAVWEALKELRLSVAYRAQKVDLRNKPGSNNLSTFQDENASPDHFLRLSASWDVTPDIECDAALRFVEEIQSNAVTIPAYATMDLRVAWKMSATREIAVVGHNLFDSHLQEHNASAQTVAGGQIPRGVFGVFKATF